MARMRSPNYPAISLKQAIELAIQLHSKNRMNVMDRETAAKDMGYTGLNGRTLKLLAALMQYDLLEKSGKGNVKITQTAVDIMHPLDEDAKVQALHKAGNNPALFQSIFERFADGIPSDNLLTSFLVQKGFTDSAIAPVLKNFLETNQFLADSNASESYSNDGENDSDSDQPQEDETETDEGSQKVREQTKTIPTPKNVTVFESGPLDYNLSSGGLKVTGKTNSRSLLNEYIEKLKALAILLPEDGPEKEDDDELLN